jgi:two-component system sensor histidine kinase RegB
MKMVFSPELSGKEQLQQLLVLRLFYLLSEIIVIGLAQWYADKALPWSYLWWVVVVHGALITFYYGYSQRRAQISEFYLFQTILVDIVLFSGLLYFSGGATNGAVSILLLPVATAAALFRWHSSLTLACVAIVSYSLLMWFYWPIEVDPHAHHQAQGFSTHLLAMWLTFIFSCLLLVWFIGLQSAAVRAKQKSLAQLRESQLKDEQLIAIATFAANAAHDLATPLSSIGLLCDELKDDYGKDGIDTLIGQVQLCQQIVKSISHQAIMNKSKIRQSIVVKDYFNGLIERWLVTRPDLELNFKLDQGLKQPFTPETNLESAIINILDNAAQASISNGANALNLDVRMLEQQLQVTITDFGTGISSDLIDSIGKEPVHSKGNGLGLGQFLANSTVQRNGGKVWRHTGANGTQTIITLPMMA